MSNTNSQNTLFSNSTVPTQDNSDAESEMSEKLCGIPTTQTMDVIMHTEHNKTPNSVEMKLMQTVTSESNLNMLKGCEYINFNFPLVFQNKL